VVKVRVPATSANLGPGFDALGLALSWHDEVEAEITETGLTIEVTGEGAGTADAGEEHLVVRAMRAAFARSGGGQPPGLALRCTNTIPQGRGLGSSAAAIVAGILAARALTTSHTPYTPRTSPIATIGPTAPISPTTPRSPINPTNLFTTTSNTSPTGPATESGPVLTLATELEGHPDNVAACLSGGLTIAWTPGGPGSPPHAVRLDPHPAVRPVICVPTTSLATTAARKALPDTVPHSHAAATAGRSALLIAALTQRPDLLFDATHDLLHEPYRGPLMPATAGLIARLRAAGIAAVLSGAGPSILALLVSGRIPGPDEVDSIANQTGTPWHVTPLDVDRHGATVQSVPLGAEPE
jgi:homoserine kinase